ncbi:choice-of-anchor Q domain-containing protein, partial [Membranihabitans marinus]|uniref:choice-of-anchor Q domain-containing protein n=1 Tax=Membranihabitans marinus TaxID=1227546 RepID=UPI001F1AC287
MKIIFPKYHNFCLLLFLFTTSQLFSNTSLNTKDLLPTVDCNNFSGVAYVDLSASGASDGTSWTDAFTDLQHALRAREDCPGSGSIDTIFVAEGTYYPTPGGTNRDTSFWLPDGVVVLGGFPAGGSSLSARDWDLYETILSGDIDGDNMPTGNSYHVVRTENVSSVTVVDGFTITGGNADGSSPNNSGGGWMNIASGLGSSSNMAIRNCAFKDNFANLYGGGMYNDNFDGEFSVELTYCDFIGNEASEGGGIYNDNFGGEFSVKLTYCDFIGNEAGEGGGMYNDNFGGEYSLELSDCAFMNNFANLNGGGIFNHNSVGIQLNDCLFSGNSATLKGGALYNYASSLYTESSQKLRYCSFTGNFASNGGAIYIDATSLGESSLILDNCVLLGNTATSNGGAIYNDANNFGESSLILNNCILSGHSATINGGAIYNDANNSGESSPILNNCVLSGNTVANDGGAIYNDANNSGESSPILNNCVLSGNTATNDGGAIYNDANNSGESTPILNNCVLSGNAATNNGGAIMSSAHSGISFMVLTNCIMYQNEASDGSVFFNVGMAIPTISHSIFDEDFATVNHASLVIDYGNNKFSTNPQFVNAPPASSAPTSAGNFHLMPTSPAIDMGQNGVNTEATDLDGFARVYNATIDIGAFEWRAIDCNLYSGKAYVDISASGANDGTSWTDAFTNLQHALRARENCLGAIDTIFVAEGTYYPTPGGINRDTSFWIPDGVVVLGGFPAGGSPLSARNWDLYQTILSGDINGDNMPTGNSYHVVRTENVSSATLVDGFTITGGNANGSTPNNSGGGWYNIGVGTGNSSNPRIRNCDFSYNTALTNGGAIYNDHSFMELMDCEFLNNMVSSSSGVYGGAIYNVSSSPVLTDCKFLGNSVSSSSSVVAAIGGAIYNSGSSPILTNCEFLNNTASSSGTTGASHGGAMYNSGSSPILTNCVISGNAASSTGDAIAGAIFNDNSSLVLTNCLLSGNIASSSNSFFAIGGALYYKNSSSLLINCVISGNTVSSSGTAAGGSIYNVNSSPQLTNCILYQNDAPDGPVFYNNGFSVPGISHSIFDVDYITVNHASIVSDNGNNQFSTDPQFVNAPPTSSAPTTAGDFHLMPSSPAINMGDPGTDLSGFFMENAGPVDLDGNPRVQNIIIDMGVYEMESCNITASNAQLSACELSNSEAEFDLESTESSVHGGMGVSYAYFTDEDATLPIVNSSAYLTTGTTIYVVVRDDITMCSDTAAITLNVTSAPIANNAMLTVCETSGGNGEFTLEDAESDVNGGMDISYAYYSDALAMTGISNPYTATDGTMVYVVVSDNNSMCSDTAAITLNVTAAPTANDAMLTECETSGGNGEFNLEDAVSDVNGNADISYDYYSDAMATSGISSPYTAMDGTTIYVVVSDDNSLCTDTAAIGLNVMGCSTVIDCNSFMGKAYVDISASGANDGTSWTNAFTDLQHALRA